MPYDKIFYQADKLDLLAIFHY